MCMHMFRPSYCLQLKHPLTSPLSKITVMEKPRICVLGDCYVDVVCSDIARSPSAVCCLLSAVCCLLCAACCLLQHRPVPFSSSLLFSPFLFFTSSLPFSSSLLFSSLFFSSSLPFSSSFLLFSPPSSSYPLLSSSLLHFSPLRSQLSVLTS
jgi:hypothetical protein